VILLKIPMSGISPQQKEGSSKKRGKKKKREKKGEQGLKRKRGETSVEMLRVSKREKKKRMISTSYWERFY
jgi:hypothetical protein